MELQEIRREHFEALLGQQVALSVPGLEPLHAELVEVRSTGAAPPAGGVEFRAPFSILLRAPRQPALGQGVVRLEHPDIGGFELFVVPVREDAESRCYEAVFG